MLKWLKQLLAGPAGSVDSAGMRRSGQFHYADEVPEGLGIRPELVAEAELWVRRLEESLPETFRNQVQERVMARHPELYPAKYRWIELEMKRFFALTALLRDVPMYSDDTDLIWHEMLMFTREYQQFCESFAGFYIHHRPNVNPAAASSGTEFDERSIFEIVYSSLFEVFPENLRLLGPFHRRKMAAELLTDIESGDEGRIRAALRFRETPDPIVQPVQDSILSEIEDKKEQARAYHYESHLGSQSSYYGGVSPLWTMMAFGMATQISPFDPVQHEAERQDEASSAGGSSYVDGVSTSGQDDNGSGDGSSSDAGDSSCNSSSCSSSSCSSSCGGGGD